MNPPIIDVPAEDGKWDIVNINDLTNEIMQIVMAGSIFTQAGQDSIREDIFQHFLSIFHVSDII